MTNHLGYLPARLGGIQAGLANVLEDGVFGRRLSAGLLDARKGWPCERPPIRVDGGLPYSPYEIDHGSVNHGISAKVF